MPKIFERGSEIILGTSDKRLHLEAKVAKMRKKNTAGISSFTQIPKARVTLCTITDDLKRAKIATNKVIQKIYFLFFKKSPPQMPF